MLNKIEEQVQYLENNPNIVLLHSNSINVDENYKEIDFLDYSNKKIVEIYLNLLFVEKVE